MKAAARALVLAAVGCGSFEDPTIIIDLRPVAVVVEPPEQVLDVDPANPLAVDLADVRVCAVVADPERRELAWSMTVCPPQRDLRCTDLAAPRLELTPEVRPGATVQVGQEACATIADGPELPAIVRATIEDDAVGGFGGVDINVVVRAVPVGGGEDEAVYAGKAVRFSARLPAERVANTNPAIAELAAQIDRGDGLEEPLVLPSGGCLGGGGGLEVPAGATIKMAPRALGGSAETYVVPTFEGGSRTFTENLRYQWLATAGSWSRGETGGPRDLAGNPPVLSTEWQAPELRAGEARRSVDVWLVQRDERGGASWLDTCFAVVPRPPR